LIVGGRWYGINTQCEQLRFVSHNIPSCANDEAQQAPLYYLAMAAWQKVVGCRQGHDRTSRVIRISTSDLRSCS
jgi:hypothetical protein